MDEMGIREEKMGEQSLCGTMPSACRQDLLGDGSMGKEEEGNWGRTSSPTEPRRCRACPGDAPRRRRSRAAAELVRVDRLKMTS
jgi:hypothetical protein